eukprot:sb/3474474/
MALSDMLPGKDHEQEKHEPGSIFSLKHVVDEKCGSISANGWKALSNLERALIPFGLATLTVSEEASSISQVIPGVKINEEYTLTLSAKAITDKVVKTKAEYYRHMTKVITREPAGSGPEPAYYSIFHDNKIEGGETL